MNTNENPAIFTESPFESRQNTFLSLQKLTPEEDVVLRQNLRMDKLQQFGWGTAYRISPLSAEVGQITVVVPNSSTPAVLVQEHMISPDGGDLYAIIQITDGEYFTTENPLSMILTPLGIVKILEHTKPASVIAAGKAVNQNKSQFSTEFLPRPASKIVVLPHPNGFKLDASVTGRRASTFANILEIIESPWQRIHIKNAGLMLAAISKNIPELVVKRGKKLLKTENLPLFILRHQNGKKIILIGDDPYIKPLESTDDLLTLGIKDRNSVVRVVGPFHPTEVYTAQIRGDGEIYEEQKVADFSPEDNGTLVLFHGLNAYLQDASVFAWMLHDEELAEILKTI